MHVSIRRLALDLGKAEKDCESKTLEIASLRQGTTQAASIPNQKDQERVQQLQSEISRLLSAVSAKDSLLFEKDQMLLVASQREAALQANASLQQASMSNPGEVEDLRKICAFYQKNSETLSKKLMALEQGAGAHQARNQVPGNQVQSWSSSPGWAQQERNSDSGPERVMPGHF
jgi:hypothetical protein